MKVLILGGTGYLGSKVLLALLEEGYEVVCVRRESTEIKHLMQEIGKRGKVQNIKFILSDLELIEEELLNTKFEFVINMVCNYGRGGECLEDIFVANIEYPIKVLNRMVGSQNNCFLTIGTGLPDDFNMYSFSKKILSDLGRFYSEKHNFNFWELKLEMFYGYDEPEDRFIPSIIRKMLSGEEVNVTLGNQHRDIVAVEDVIKAIKVVLKSKEAGYNVISVGTGVGPKVSEIVSYIWEITGKKSKINWGAIKARDNEPDCIANTSRIKGLMEMSEKWEPINWKLGIEKMVWNIKETYNENID